MIGAPRAGARIGTRHRQAAAAAREVAPSPRHLFTRSFPQGHLGLRQYSLHCLRFQIGRGNRTFLSMRLTRTRILARELSLWCQSTAEPASVSPVLPQ
jgi:hypothetical protein